MTAFKAIKFETKDNVARITLNRPEALNAFNEQMLLDLNQALDKIEQEKPPVQVVVITGTGRAFSAGRDLKELKATPPEKRNNWQQIIGPRTLYRIENLPQVVIAAINGIAFAGGLELAMACDIIIASETAQIGDRHANYGLSPGGWGGAERLVRLIGINRAKWYVLTGENIPIDEAVRLGLVNKAVPADKLESAVQEVVDKLLTKNPKALKAVKRMINYGVQTDLYTSLELEHYIGFTAVTSPESKEGLKAFSEKKKTIEFGGKKPKK